MEISSSNIKINPYIFSKERFSYISTNGTLQFSPQVRKIKKPSLKREQRKKFLSFLKRKLFLCFRKRKPRKTLYISGSRTFLYFKKIERNALATSFKNLLYIRRKLAKPENQKVILSLFSTETFKVWLSSYIK